MAPGDKTHHDKSHGNNLHPATHPNTGFPSLYEPQSQQRTHKPSELDELTRHTGTNLKGYMPRAHRQLLTCCHHNLRILLLT